jgi:hypothetical protein
MQALEQLKTRFQAYVWKHVLSMLAHCPRAVDSLGPLIPPPCFHPQGATGGQFDSMKDL